MHFCFLSANQPFALHLSALAVPVTIQEGLSRNKQDTQHSAWSCSARPHKLSLVSSRLHTPIPSSLRIPTLQSICLNSRPFPPTQPLCLQSKSRHYHPRQPASTDSWGTAPGSAVVSEGFSSPCCGSGSLRQQSGFACDFAIWECEPGGRTPG